MALSQEDRKEIVELIQSTQSQPQPQSQPQQSQSSGLFQGLSLSDLLQMKMTFGILDSVMKSI